MFYSSYGTIITDKKPCPPAIINGVKKIEEIKANALKLIEIASKKSKLENVNKEIVIKLINQEIDSFYDIYSKSNKNEYNINILNQKTSDKFLKIDIDRLITLITNKSNFSIDPKTKTSDTNVIPHKELTPEEKNLTSDISKVIKMTEKVAHENDFTFFDKLILAESSLIRLHHAYHIYQNSKKTELDKKHLSNSKKLILASIRIGLLLDYGYFLDWESGVEQIAMCMIQPERFDNQIFKIKKIDDKLYYLLPPYSDDEKSYPKCIYDEPIKNMDNINVQVNITLIKLFSLRKEKEQYKNCKEFIPEKKENKKVIEKYQNINLITNNDKIFYQANGKITKY